MSQKLDASTRGRKNLAIALTVACACLLVLPSCGIPYLRLPKHSPRVPEDFNGATSAESSAQVPVEEFFQDPFLTNLIHQAIVGNQELRSLGEDVQIANNEILARKGRYLPFLTFGGSMGFNRYSRYSFEGSVEEQLNILPGKAFPNPLGFFAFGPNFVWTPDVWRQLHNARDSAVMRYYAASEARNYNVTRLVAEIAENYYGLIALDKRLENINNIIALQEKSLKFAQASLEAARGTLLAVQRFQAEVRKNQSERLIVLQEIIQVENRINFLVGRFPQRVERKTSNTIQTFIDLNLHMLSVGLPAQLLQNRPDVRQAEFELASTGLDIKVARKNFYPQGAITSAAGYEAFNPRFLLITPEAMVANLAAQAAVPWINKKAIQAEYMTANARQLQAVYNYQRTVIKAFNEVVTNLTKVQNYLTSIEIKKQQVRALEGSVESATRLFQNARAEYIDVLFAQRDLLDARRVLIDTKREQLGAIVNTYQSLGGGAYLLPVLAPVALQPHYNPGRKHFGGPSPTPEPLPRFLPPMEPAPEASQPPAAGATGRDPEPPPLPDSDKDKDKEKEKDMEGEKDKDLGKDDQPAPSDDPDKTPEPLPMPDTDRRPEPLPMPAAEPRPDAPLNLEKPPA